MGISHSLKEFGFHEAVGTIEKVSLKEQVVVAKREAKLTFDTNNGVMAVYDEDGQPWLLTLDRITPEIAEWLKTSELTRGAYVPHSNDGGHYIRQQFPSRT